MSRYEFSAAELAEYELGQMIGKVSDIAYDKCGSFEKAADLFITIKPTLTYQQIDAWHIVLDLMEQEAAA